MDPITLHRVVTTFLAVPDVPLLSTLLWGAATFIIISVSDPKLKEQS